MTAREDVARWLCAKHYGSASAAVVAWSDINEKDREDFRVGADALLDLLAPHIAAAVAAARAEVKAAVEEWFTDVDLDDMFAAKGWSAPLPPTATAGTAAARDATGAVQRRADVTGGGAVCVCGEEFVSMAGHRAHLAGVLAPLLDEARREGAERALQPVLDLCDEADDPARGGIGMLTTPFIRAAALAAQARPAPSADEGGA